MMFARNSLVLAFAGITAISPMVRGQQLQEAAFEGMPSVYFDPAGKVTGCGLRFYALDSTSAHKKFRSIDLSIVLSTDGAKRGIAMVKGYSAEATPQSVAAGRTKPIKVQDAWIRAQGQERTRPVDGKFIQSPESPTAVLYWSTATSVMSVLMAALDDKQVQLQLKREGDASHPVYFGSVKMSEPDSMQFSACLTELLPKIEAGLR